MRGYAGALPGRHGGARCSGGGESPRSPCRRAAGRFASKKGGQRRVHRDKLKPILFSIIGHSTKEELKRQIPKDIVSGIVVAVVALPLSIALAIASGVGPEQGLYTAIVAGFIIALMGGSAVQISSPTAARSPPSSPVSWRPTA